MHRVTCIALALLVLALPTGCSTSRQVRRPSIVGAPTRHVLSNGVRVIVQEHRASDVVALQLWVRAGGRDEEPTELGLAHYLEHMVFKGTAMRPVGAIERDVESVGGRVNAGTSLDYTYYHLVLPAPRMGSGLEILADISVNAALDPTALEREKKVVLEEMRRNQDSPARALSERLHGVLFDPHPYGRPILGTAEVVSGLTREQLLAFYRRYYVPEAFTLVVVGAVDPDDVLTSARRLFGHMPRSGSQRLPAPGPPPVQPRAVESARPGTQAYLALGWLAPRVDHADTPAVDLLVSIVGQLRSSRLTQALRERLALVNTIGASYTPLEAAGFITISAQLDPRNVTRAEEEILIELRRVADNGVSDVELTRAVTAAEASQELRTETAEGRARELGLADSVWTLDGELAYLDRIRAVTREQIQAAARRYFDRHVRVAFVPAGTR